MKKILSILALAALIAAPAFAADAEYTTREAWRTGVVTAIFDSAVAFVGDITVATNATVAGTVQGADLVATDDVIVGGDVVVTGKVTIGETLAVTGATTLTGAQTLTGNTTLNGTLTMLTNKFTVSAAGAVVAAGALTSGATPVWTQAAVAAPTGTASQGFTITVNGTNYVIALYPN